MDLTPEQAASAVERHECPNCAAPAGSPCRTRGGRTAAKYHTPRFSLVPALREELDVAVPSDRHPGRAWAPGPELSVVGEQHPVRIGYARTSTARQELGSQLQALRRAQCHKIFSEQISTRVKVRPELAKALALARQFAEAAPQTPVILTVHELKRLARNAAELMTLSAELQAGGIRLEMLSGPLTGIYDPDGMGSMLFAVLAVAAQLDRDYIRDKTLEGQQAAAAKGNHGGRPKVIDEDMLTFALALKDKGVPVPEIAGKLTIKTGKNAGKSPSVASLYRALGEAEDVPDHRLWRIDRTADYGPLNTAARGKIDTARIRRHWDDILRVVASIHTGAVRAYDVIRMLSRDGNPTPLGQAIAHAGRLFKTLHVLSYIDDETYRRSIKAQTTLQESRHALGRHVFHGKRGELRQRYIEGMEDQLGALGLVLNCITLWNTVYMDAALDQLRAEDYPVREEDVVHLSAFARSHINVHGHYSFRLPDMPGGRRELRDPDQPLDDEE